MKVEIDAIVLSVLLQHANHSLNDLQRRRDEGERVGDVETESWVRSAVERGSKALTTAQQSGAADRVQAQPNQSTRGGG